MYDVVIRGGAIHDGTGGPAHNGDVAIKDGVIAAVGKFRSTEARQTIEADGAIVTPGFIDLHSHYDGQFLWDDKIDPSFTHGITTSIAGNCGVGVAPVNDEYQSKLIEFMTGVEEIPEIVMEVGLDWSWRSFPEYLQKVAAVSGRPLNYGVLEVFTDEGDANNMIAESDHVRMVHDLPTGAGRVLQPSSGYPATLVNGVPTRLDDEDTLARPGRLVRSTAFSPELAG